MFEKILRDQQREIEDLLSTERIVHRQLKIPLEKGIAIIITGVRRSGKSVFAHLLLRSANDSSYGYVNFDDERFGTLAPNGFQEILTTIHTIYGSVSKILLDEPQNQPKWELFVNRLLRRKYTVIITGSNSTLLSSEFSTHLTGRYLRYELFPFCFKEYMDFQNVSIDGYSDEKIGTIQHYLENYISSGGFPETFKFRDSNRYLRDLLNSILMKDIAHRYKIQKIADLEKLAYYFLSVPSSYYTYSKLAGSLGMNKYLISTYLKYLENAYLFFSLPLYSRRYKTQHRSPRKIYSVDLGINAKIGFRTETNITHQIENLVFLELKRRTFRKSEIYEIFYWKSPEQYEVDFVIKSGPQILQLIQVSYKLIFEKTRIREEKGLLKASEELGCDNLILISWDEERTLQKKGKEIKYIPLWKWLMAID